MSSCNSASSIVSAASKRSGMSRPANTVRWRPRARPAWVARGVKSLVVVMGLVVGAQYLAGVLFLLWVRADIKEATPLTISRYAYHYGAREDVRKKLWLCSAVALVSALVALVAALRPKAPPLHGDARFSTRAE